MSAQVAAPSDIVFVDPTRLWLLAIVVVVAVAYVVAQLRAPRYRLRFTQLDLLDVVAPRRPRWRKHLVAVGTLLAMATLTLASARPHIEAYVGADRSGALVVTLDTSLSMEATDVAPNRFDVAREAATEFVESIPQPVQVGLVSFNGEVTLQVAPTTDRQRVVDAIAALQLGESTAIGDAVATSVAALVAGDFLAPPDEGGASSARVVLLSDGGNTVGRPVEEGAALAVEAGVPISTIAYGTPAGTVVYQGQVIPVPVDGPALNALADATGGQFYEAATADDLSEVYADIGGTVSVERDLVEVTDQFVLAGLLVLLVAAGGSLVWFSRIP